MPRVALTTHDTHAQANRPAPFDPAPAFKGGKNIMKTLDSIIAVISWIILAIVLWALAPLLIRLMDMADHIHGVFR